MALGTPENLPAEAQLALAHTPPILRDPLRIFLELDQRLGRIVAATSEPMLGQMRLAWWRDMLGKPVEDRPRGDSVLDGIGDHWLGREAGLVKLVDGWEHLLDEPPLSENAASRFLSARQEALMTVFGQKTGSDRASVPYDNAAWRWAASDLAAKVSLEEERDLLVTLGLANENPNSSLPRKARGLAVLGALGSRALKRGGRPLMEGRTASLVATRAAIFGR